MRLSHIAVLLALLASPALLVGCGRSVSRATDDVGITTRVKTALLNEPNLSASAIQVEAAGGVVTLNGTVRSEAERVQAVAVAQRTSGVTDVRSNLQVAAQ
jgi:hyperosmotically inducible protein